MLDALLRWLGRPTRSTDARAAPTPKKPSSKRKAVPKRDGAATTPRPVLWRIAHVVNPRTGKPVIVEVRADGTLGRSEVARLGLEHVAEWMEVRAGSRAEARALIAQGKGERMSRESKCLQAGQLAIKPAPPTQRCTSRDEASTRPDAEGRPVG